MFVATIFLLAVVVDLVPLEFSHKVINHFDHFCKPIAVQSHGNEVTTGHDAGHDDEGLREPWWASQKPVSDQS